MADNFSIAILMENLTEAKRVSDVLRDLGYFAHFYNDLGEMWVGVNAETPDFILVDVIKMTDGDMSLKNHPKLIQNKLPIAFYYSEETSILLSSTYNIPHYGYIRREGDLNLQLQSVLQRRQGEIKLLQKNKELEEKNARLATRSKQISDGADDFLQFERDVSLMTSLMDNFGALNKGDSFVERVVSILSHFEHTISFSLYELNQTKQKILSPTLHYPKYKTLPSLWLGKVCSNGLDPHAIDMASEVSLDEFKTKSFRMIKVSGANENPDLLILGEFEVEKIKHFPWKMFERELSSQYRKHLLNKVDHKVEGNQFLPFWEAFSNLDDVSFHNITSQDKVFSMNFTNLIDTVLAKNTNRFYFKAFYTDFLCNLANVVGQGKISVTSPTDVMILLNMKELEARLSDVKKFVAEFSYWKYFEDGSLVMTSRMFPEIKMIAPASASYLRNMTIVQDDEKAIEVMAKKWTRKPLELQ